MPSQDAAIANPVDLGQIRHFARNHFAVDKDSALRQFFVVYLATLVPLCFSLLLVACYPGVQAMVAAAIVAGFTQNALGILMHEGSHYFFHKSPLINDRIADLFVCLPIFNTVAGYRRLHTAHHLKVGDVGDPGYNLYADVGSRAEIVKGLLRDISGITAISSFAERYISRNRGDASGHLSPDKGGLLKLAVVQGAIAAALYAVTGLVYSYFVLWILPLLIIPFLINRIRTMVEHAALVPGSEMENRTTLSGPVERLFFAPYGYMHHFEHHLCPYIPFYQLPAFRRFLSKETGMDPGKYTTSGGYLKTFLGIIQSRKVQS